MKLTRLGVLGLVGVLVLGFLSACGGGGDTNEFRRGGAEVDEAVDGFIQGWVRGSGTARDTIAASQTRRYLGGALGERVANAKVGGSQTEEPLERVYNDIMGVPFPPDGDPLYEITESQALSDTEARVTVTLNYTANAAASLAALGVISFENVQKFHEQVTTDNVRILNLVKGEVGWQIHTVEGSTTVE
jgi:hypothetical protein